MFSFFKNLFPSPVTTSVAYQPTPEEAARMAAIKPLADQAVEAAKVEAASTAYNLAIQAEQLRAMTALLEVAELNNQLIKAKATPSDLDAGTLALEAMLKSVQAQQRAKGLIK